MDAVCGPTTLPTGSVRVDAGADGLGSALLRMDADMPRLVEERVIVATTDNLTEIELRFSASDSGPPSASSLYGGEITRTERVTPNHTKFTLRPAGEDHRSGRCGRIALTSAACPPTKTAGGHGQGQQVWPMTRLGQSE